MPDYFRETPEQTRIAAEIRVAEGARKRYDHVSQAGSAEVDRARAAVDAPIDAGMPEIYYIGLRRYLSIRDRPQREAEFRRQIDGGDRGNDP